MWCQRNSQGKQYVRENEEREKDEPIWSCFLQPCVKIRHCVKTSLFTILTRKLSACTLISMKHGAGARQSFMKVHRSMIFNSMSSRLRSNGLENDKK